MNMSELNKKILAPFMKIMNDYASMYSKPIVFSNNLQVTFAEIQVLNTIIAHNITQPVELAKYLHISKPAITKYSNKLEKKGLLSKVKSTVDHRSHSLKITKLGQNIHHEYHEYLNGLIESELSEWLDKTDDKTLESFSEYIEITNDLIKKIRSDIQSMSE